MNRVRVLLLLLCVLLGGSCRVADTSAPTAAGAAPKSGASASTPFVYTPSQPYGYLPGTFAADGTGAATFELPIDVPPGTAGIQPQLSLTYNSHRGNGYVGMGWQLSGFSAIGRCGATFEQDGFKAGVAFDARDRFCLDGNRLMAVSGAYGADGTVYHTERETQTAVVSHGTCGSGPCSFSARNKDGDALSFGATAGSRILAQGRTDGSVRAWAIDRQTDLNGNYSAVTYSNDPASGEYLPLRIDYTGNDVTGQAPQRSVVLTFEERPDPVRRFLGGSLVQATKRLQSIATYVDAQLVRTYRAAYDVSAFTERSRLVSVTACDAANVCLPPVRFDWQTEAESLEATGPQLPGPLYAIVGGQVYPIGVLQDFDGDGIADYSAATEFISSTTTTDLRVWRGQPDGTFVEAGFSLPGPLYRASSTSVVMTAVLQDLDGDAILDYSPATYNTNTGASDLSVYLGTRNGFRKASFSLPDAVYWQVSGQTLQTGILSDMNGDGIPDYSRATKFLNTGQLELAIWKGTGSGYESTGKSLPGPLFLLSSTSVRGGILEDIDGDGVPDYSPATVNANTGASDLTVWIGQTPDFTFTPSFDLPGQMLWMVNGQALDSGILVDLNGDGIPDYSRATELISTGQKLFDVYLGTGRGFNPAGFTLPGPIYLITGSIAEITGVLTQVNGDGTARYSRATRFPDGSSDLAVWLGSGEGFRKAAFSLPEPLFELIGGRVYAKGIYEDLNGDGMTDFANTACTMTQPGAFTNCSLGVRLARGPFSDLLSTITNSFGGTTSIEYVPISRPDVYSRGGAAAYPLRDGQSSTYAVSRYVTRDGRGASYAFRYAYTGARFDVLGRNWLGFSSVLMTEEAGGRSTESIFSTDYPYNGLVVQTAVRDGAGKLLETTAATYADVAPAAHQTAGVHQPLQTSFTDTFYQDGTAAYSVRTDWEYDQYGNPVLEAQQGDPATGVLPVFRCVRYQNDDAPTVNRLGYALQEKATRTAESCQAFLDVADGADVQWDPATDLSWGKRTYDTRMNQLSESEWDDSHNVFLTVASTFDAYGNTLSLTNAGGATTTYTYDPVYHSFLDTVTSPQLTRADGSQYTLTASNRFEPRFGVLTETVDENGNVQRQEVDGFGRPVAQWGPNPDGVLVRLNTTLWKNDGTNYLESRMRPSWSSSDDTAAWYWSRERYDGLWRAYRQERNGLKNGQPATIVTALEFDAQARVHRNIAAHFDGDPQPVTVTEYDALNRPTLTTGPSGTKDRVDYFDGGLRFNQTLAYGTPLATTQIEILDTDGRPRQRVAQNGQSVSFTYDPLGRPATVATAPLSRPTTFTFDSVDRLRTISRADTGTTAWTYDASGRIRRVVDAAGNAIEIDAYDAAGRPLQRTATYGANRSTWKFTYDETAYRNGLAHITSVVIEEPVAGTVTYHYAWDAYEHALGAEVTLAGTTYSYATLWDPLGRAYEEIDPNGARTALHYGADANLAAVDVTHPGSTAASRYGTFANYTALGQLQDLTLDQNGVQVARRFYAPGAAFGKLQSIAATSPRQGGQSLASLTYAWNQLGEITSIADNDDAARTQTFGYRDQPLNAGMGFLTSANGAYGAKSYQYEQLGNVTRQNATTYTYTPGTDQLSGSSAGVTWSFAANGFLQNRTDSAATALHTFDADGNLVGIARTATDSGTGQTTLEAAYDHTGRKIVEKTAGGPTVYAISGTYEVADFGDRVQHTHYVDGPLGRIAAITGDGTGIEGLTGASQRNRVRALLGGQGNVAARVQSAFFALLSVATSPALVELVGTSLLVLLVVATLALMLLPTFAARRRCNAVVILSRRHVPRSGTHGGEGPSNVRAIRKWLRGKVLRRHAFGFVGEFLRLRMTTNGAFRVALTDYARLHSLFARVAPVVIACMLLSIALPAYAELSPGGNGAGIPTAGRLFFVQDLVGSTISVTDDEGAETARVAYEPFGRLDQAASRGTDNFRPKFGGKELDPAHGLYDFAARRYDPVLGRFISPDPANQYVSPYLYGANDPISMLDPTGELALLAAIVVGAVVGAYFGAVAVNGTLNPADWNWQSGSTWAGIFFGAAIGAVGAAAGGLVVQAGVAVGSMGGTSAQLAAVAIGIGGEALIGAGEGAAFAALGGGSGKEIARAAVGGAIGGAIFGGVAEGIGLARQGMRNADNALDGDGAAAARRAGDGGDGNDAPCSCGCASFAAGTPVRLADGSFRAIETVAAGDRLTGRLPQSGRVADGEVEQLVRHQASALVRVTLATGERIEVTPEHRFYVDRRGWRNAAHLAPGEPLATADGTAVLVSSVEAITLDAPVAVYNFEVGDTASYAAGQAAVLVHNARGDGYCTAEIDANGKVVETWNTTLLQKRFPDAAEYAEVLADIERKATKANKLVLSGVIKPMTRVTRPVRTASREWLRDRFIRKSRNWRGEGIRVGLQKLRPRHMKQDVDEFISRIQGGLTIREGVAANQGPLNSFVNSTSGSAMGALARRYKVPRKITGYGYRLVS